MSIEWDSLISAGNELKNVGLYQGPISTQRFRQQSYNHVEST